MSGNAHDPGRSTPNRLFALLDAFANDRPSMTLSQLARAAGLPTSTAHRLLGELVEWGGLTRTDDGSYRIGLRLWQLGSLAPQERDLRTVALPYMEDLYEATHETVQLAVPDRSCALVIEAVSGRRSVTTRSRPGARLPLYASAVGKVLMAFTGPDLLKSTIADGLERQTPHTIMHVDVLGQQVRRVRTTQLGYSREELTLGVSSVAAPVFGSVGSPVAALGVVVRATTDLTLLGPAVRTAALGITRRLQELAAQR